MSELTLREKAIKTGDKKSSLVVYKAVRGLLRMVVKPWVRSKAINSHFLDLEGPTILAPAHRSHLDSLLIAVYSKRRIRALGKESLFKVPVLSFFCAALGAIPVRRESADKDAMKAALDLLNAGETMIVFPEGARQSGNDIADCFDGPAWLASKSGARVIPIGIVGSEKAMPAGSKFIHRSNVVISVGDPMYIEPGINSKRHSRDELKQFTQLLREKMQHAQNNALDASSRT